MAATGGVAAGAEGGICGEWRVVRRLGRHAVLQHGRLGRFAARRGGQAPLLFWGHCTWCGYQQWEVKVFDRGA
jgi:hypothetical protein